MHPQLRLFALQLFLDFRAIFLEWPLIFLVITIHQVIWPSPGTLLADRISCEVVITSVNIKRADLQLFLDDSFMNDD